jgi:uncharacterized SAM-binding protein YcdF (DUF218 family)
MFFLFSKTLALLAIPSNLIGGLFIAGVLLFATRWRATGKRLVAVGVVLLTLFGFLPLGSLLLLPLTERFPAWSNHGGDPDGMIILGAGINPKISLARDSIEVTSSAGRITAVADLARRFPHSRVVVSGGSGDLHDQSAPEAPLTARLLESFGVATERIVLEDHSRNTAENAAFTRKLLQPKAGERWLLITSAQHMPRAVGCFRNVGFSIEPYPVDWQSVGWTTSSMSISTLSDGLSRTDGALHEWLGLIFYRITGRTSELFPGPRE